MPSQETLQIYQNLFTNSFLLLISKKIKDGNADLVIEILNNNFAKRILSLAGNGQVGEFELVQTIEYRFKTNGQWTEPRKLEAIREYTYDPTLYNAAAAEEGF
jgi:outer membrane lipopolysaccharide assembly protein LptE/RlpB